MTKASDTAQLVSGSGLFTSTTGNVGIGTSSPTDGLLHLNGGASTNIKFTNATTGTTNTDGFFVGLSSNPDTIGYVFQRENAALIFGTNNLERARIDASGNLLVGKTSVSNGIVGLEYVVNGTTPYMVMTGTASTNAANSYHVYSTGAGAYRFYVGYGGTIFATSTSITGISDASLKENIRDLDTGLTQVMALRPRRFDWKEETKIDEKNVAGFIAQEVEQVLPELVYDYQYTAEETKKSLKMGDMLPTLVKAIQEQQAMIEELKAKVAALEAK